MISGTLIPHPWTDQHKILFGVSYFVLIMATIRETSPSKCNISAYIAQLQPVIKTAYILEAN